MPNTDAAPAMPAAAAGALAPSGVDARHAYASSSAMAGPDFQHSRLSVASTSPGGHPPPAGQTPLGSPRRKPTGLQSIDPLTAAKEAASVPLRAMPSYKQMPSPRGESQQQGPSAHSVQDVSNRSAAAGSHHDDAFAPKDAIASNDWSDFAAAHPEDSSNAQQSPRQHAQTQDTTSAAGADLWAQWSVPVAQDVAAGTETRVADGPATAVTGQLSLLDL